MCSRFILLIFGFLFSFDIYSQTVVEDSVYILNNVDVYQLRVKKFKQGYKFIEFDSLNLKSYSSTSLGDFLSNSSGVNIKSYGFGGLSGLSLRGGGSNKNSIIWNGVQIESPMNGGFNLSSLPLEFFEDVQIQMGGSGALMGSGSLFGQLSLSSIKNIEGGNYNSLSFSAGSFDTYSTTATSRFRVGNTFNSLKILYQFSENDFTFKNTNKIYSPIERQTNSSANSRGLAYDFKLKLNSDNSINFSSIFQKSHKQIPTLMSSYTINDEYQNDLNFISSAVYNKKSDLLNINFKNSLVYNGIDSYIPASSPEEIKNSSLSVVSELEGEYKISKKYAIYSALIYRNDRAKSSGYTDTPFRDRFSLITLLKMAELLDFVELNLSVRQELIDSKWNPVQYSVASNLYLTKSVNAYFNLSRVYKNPTLNDLYWKDSGFASGNPALKDESGYSFDFGSRQNLHIYDLSMAFGQSLFYNRLRDMILWLPGSNSKWMPVNISQARSSGVEVDTDIKYNFSRSLAGVKVNYFFTNSLISNDNGHTWKNQIYTPRHKLNSKLFYIFKQFEAAAVYNFNSKRYTVSDQNYLKGYQTLDLLANYNFVFNNFRLDLNIRANNIFGENYQLTADYAMPRQNLVLTVKTIF